jgi:hypothetical protein
MGLDVQTSASVLAAAAVVQTVRLRRQRAQQGVGSSDVEVPLLSKDARQRRALKVTQTSDGLPSFCGWACV